MHAQELEKLDDLSLVARAKEDDLEAFAVLYGRYRQLCLGIARRMVKHDAEDIVQEGMIACYQNLGNLLEDHRFSSFLCGCVRNVALAQLRARRLRRLRECEAGSRHEDPLGEAQQNPVHVLAIEEELTVFRACFAKLKDRCRHLLEMHYIGGMSFREMEEIVRRTASSICEAVNRCKRELRKMIALAPGIGDLRP